MTDSTRPLRVLVVYPSLPHYRLSVFQELDRLPGFEFHFAAGPANSDGTIVNLDPTLLTRVHELSNVWYKNALWQRRLFALVNGRWDAVVFLGDAAHLSTWASALLLKCRPKTRVLMWTIGWHKPDAGLKKLVRMSFYRLADALLLYGDQARQWGMQVGYPADRMFPIYNSIGRPEGASPDASALADLREALANVNNGVGTVIRLTEIKRLDLLVEAAAVARNELGYPLEVLLAGTGPMEDMLRDLASRRGVPLTLVGPMYTHLELQEFYRKCAVACIPTRAGLSVIQALSYGRPVVTHDNPEEQMPEAEAIIPGVNGALYRQNDVRDLARQLVHWAELSPSPELERACRGTIDEKWSAAPQALAIADAIKKLSRRL